MYIPYPGMKNTPLYKLLEGNINKCSPSYHHNNEPRNIKDVIWGSGTTEAMKSSLTDGVVTEGCALITSNKFYSFISELDKYSNTIFMILPDFNPFALTNVSKDALSI